MCRRVSWRLPGHGVLQAWSRRAEPSRAWAGPPPCQLSPSGKKAQREKARHGRQVTHERIPSGDVHHISPVPFTKYVQHPSPNVGCPEIGVGSSTGRYPGRQCQGRPAVPTWDPSDVRAGRSRLGRAEVWGSRREKIRLGKGRDLVASCSDPVSRATHRKPTPWRTHCTLPGESPA